MQELDWQQIYRPAEITNQQLADDWRLFVAAIANLDKGVDEPYTEAEIYVMAVACAKEIAKRVHSGNMNYTISKDRGNAYETLWSKVKKKLEVWELSALTGSLDSLGLLNKIQDSKHRRDRCMECSKKPEYEVLWAEGIAHAWFCEKHLKEWLTKSVASCAEEGYFNKNCELNSVKRIDGEEASVKFVENKNGNILNSFLSKIPMPKVDKERKREKEEAWGRQESIGLKDSEELAPVNPSGVERGEEITLEELKKYFKSFYRTKPYVSIIGGLCTQGKTKGDIDIFIRSAHRDIATEFRIIRMFPEKYWFRFRFRYPYEEETHPGIFTNFMDIYDEKIEVISRPELVLMSVPKKVELFEFAPLLKPLTGRHKMEEYTIDNLINIVNARWDYTKKVAAQRKFDGIHVEVHHSKEGNVVIFTEEGNEITDKLPTIISELKETCKGHDVIVPGELESWEKSKHNPRQETTAIIHSKGIHEEEGTLKLNIFDCLLYDLDIHNELYSARLKYLNKLQDSAHIIKAETKIVDNEKDLRKAVKHFSSQEGSEGAYLKIYNGFPYELDGETRENIKFKNTNSWDVEVKRVDKIKGANAWSYLCIIRDPEGNEVPVGKSYNTSVGRIFGKEPLKLGDVLKISFVNLNKYIDPKTKKIWFNMWSPRPLLWREGKEHADNIFTAAKLVEASNGTVTEKSWPTRYEDAYSIDELDAQGYIKSPSEDKKWLGMLQFDSRKKNVGIDFRWQVSDSEIAAFTVFIPKGLSRIPENPVDAQKILTKEILPLTKETMADPLKKFNCQPKKNISATKDVFKEIVGYGPGYDRQRFMWTVDSFQIEHGCKKPDYVELFCDGDLINGRIIFVKIENKKEWTKTPEGDYTWMMFKTKSKLPYVISARAVKKKWVPPFTHSALPKDLKSKVPEGSRYWEIKDSKKRREKRDELVARISEKLLKIDTDPASSARK